MYVKIDKRVVIGLSPQVLQMCELIIVILGGDKWLKICLRLHLVMCKAGGYAHAHVVVNKLIEIFKSYRNLKVPQRPLCAVDLTWLAQKVEKRSA